VIQGATVSEVVEDLFDGGCAPWTGECVRFECQTWEGRTPVRPKLAPDANGFWRCPKCGGSYGREAVWEAIAEGLEKVKFFGPEGSAVAADHRFGVVVDSTAARVLDVLASVPAGHGDDVRHLNGMAAAIEEKFGPDEEHAVYLRDLARRLEGDGR
jgi:hypothetical protein